MSEITRNPLCWPDSVPRIAPHLRGTPRFTSQSLAYATRFVREEINRLNGRWGYDDGGKEIIISSNLRLNRDGTPASAQSEPADTGIAVYFTLVINRNGRKIERPIVMSCDKWRRTNDNLYAIGKDIEAQRARERWGCTNYEQSFRGYLAIPEKCGGPAWWDVLDVAPCSTKAFIELAFKSKAKSAHPDAGGSALAFSKLQKAYEQAMAQFR